MVGTSAFEAVSRKVRKAVVEVLESGSRAPRVVWPRVGFFKETSEIYVSLFCPLECIVCEAAGNLGWTGLSGTK